MAAGDPVGKTSYLRGIMPSPSERRKLNGRAGFSLNKKKRPEAISSGRKLSCVSQ